MITLDDIKKSACSHRNQHLFAGAGKMVKKSKFGNKKCVVDDIVFDSEKEAKRYGELKLLLKAGEIGFLERQVPFELNPGGTYSLKYIADFVYIDAKTGEKIVEDVKPMRVSKKTGKLFRTQVYKKKKRLMFIFRLNISIN